MVCFEEDIQEGIRIVVAERFFVKVLRVVGFVFVLLMLWLVLASWFSWLDEVFVS